MEIPKFVTVIYSNQLTCVWHCVHRLSVELVKGKR